MDKKIEKIKFIKIVLILVYFELNLDKLKKIYRIIYA